jgi:hypothetical protein
VWFSFVSFSNHIKQKRMQTDKIQDQYLGCLLGGAIGEALGAPVEGMDFRDIIETYGPEGINDFVRQSDVHEELGDLISMFNQYGLRAPTQKHLEERFGSSHVPMIYHAYFHWLQTRQFSLPDSVLERLMDSGAMAGVWRIRRQQDGQSTGTTVWMKAG